VSHFWGALHFPVRKCDNAKKLRRPAQDRGWALVLPLRLGAAALDLARCIEAAAAALRASHAEFIRQPLGGREHHEVRACVAPDCARWPQPADNRHEGTPGLRRFGPACSAARIGLVVAAVFDRVCCQIEARRGFSRVSQWFNFRLKML
jgi:hypothetical protein